MEIPMQSHVFMNGKLFEKMNLLVLGVMSITVRTSLMCAACQGISYLFVTFINSTSSLKRQE